MSRIFVEDFVNSNQKSRKSNYNYHSFFINFQNLFVFLKNEDVIRIFVEDFVNSNQKSGKSNYNYHSFLKNFPNLFVFSKNEDVVVFSLRISLIQTKNLIKQMQFSLAFSKIIRFFKKRRYESFFH